MSKYILLIENIQHSDLSKADKNTLITILTGSNDDDDDFDFDDFAKKIIAIYGISETILKLFLINSLLRFEIKFSAASVFKTPYS